MQSRTYFRVRLVLTALLLGLLATGAGCPRLPLDALQVYSDSFDKARRGGHLIYEQAGPAFDLVGEEARKRARENAMEQGKATLFPARIPLSAKAAGDRLDPALEARILLLDTVATYNEILMQMASGATAEEVSLGLARMVDSGRKLASFAKVFANAAFPGSGAILGAVQGLAAMAEKARAQADARAALLEDEDKVRAALQLLLDDVNGLQKTKYPKLTADATGIYGVQSEYYERALAEIYKAMLRASRESRRLAGRHRMPGDGTLIAKRQALDARFEAAWRDIGAELALATPEMLSARAGGAGAAAYDSSANGTLGALVDALEASRRDYDARRREWLAYRSALSAYGDMLAASRDALDAVVVAAREPASTRESFYRLLAIAGEVRAHAVTIIGALE